MSLICLHRGILPVIYPPCRRGHSSMTPVATFLSCTIQSGSDGPAVFLPVQDRARSAPPPLMDSHGCLVPWSCCSSTAAQAVCTAHKMASLAPSIVRLLKSAASFLLFPWSSNVSNTRRRLLFPS